MTALTREDRDSGRRAVLEARAADLARPHDDGSGTEPMDVLVATVGGQAVAVPVEQLREVRPPTRLAAAPGSSAALVGVAGGHGEALVVASLAALLELTPSQPSTEQWVVVLDDTVAPVGLLVDTADDVVTVDRRETSPHPESSALIAAVTHSGMLVLDTAALLSDDRLFLFPRPDATEAASWHDA